MCIVWQGDKFIPFNSLFLQFFRGESQQIESLSPIDVSVSVKRLRKEGTM